MRSGRKPGFHDRREDPGFNGQVLQALAELAGHGVALCDAYGYCCYANSVLQNLTGYDAHELRLSPLEDLLQIQALSSAPSRASERYSLSRKDGSTLIVQASFVPVEGSHQSLWLVQITPVNPEVLDDITRHIVIEEGNRLQAINDQVVLDEDARYKAFFNQTSQYAGLLSLDGTVLEANLASLKSCGYQRHEIVGRKFWLCGWWNRSRRIREQIKRACMKAASGSQVRRELTYFLADGSERVTDLIIGPVTDDNGEVVYLAASGADITDRKRNEAALRVSEERYRLLTELSPDALLVERKGRILYINTSAMRLFGAARAKELLHTHSLNLIAPDYHNMLKRRRAQVWAKKTKSPLMELKAKRLDGTDVEVQAVCGKVVWEGRPAIQILLRDVSELKKTKEKLRLVSERLKLAIEGTGEGIWDWDIRNNSFVFAGGLNSIIGEGASSKGRSEAWTRLIHPEDLERVAKTFKDAMEDRVPLYECEYRLRDKEGRWRWIWARGVTVERDERGRPLIMTGTLSDITVRKESDELAWRHANLDALTGLPSRRLFRERLETEVARLARTGHSLALLFIDLDGFKQVNDFFGHDAGDALLMEVARRLKMCVRQTDTVSRLGGDEFTIILTELDFPDHVEFVCQKILLSLAEPFLVGKDVAYVSGSIGVSLYPFDSRAAEDLIRKADQAMYEAKRSGKNQFHYFTREMDDRAHSRLRITNELRHALQARQLEVHYQPVLDLRTGRVVKAEALLRWRHPVLGNIEPSEFIPIAEESGLIQKIGDWVFREAALCCKQCSEIISSPFQIGVNKSPAQLLARESGSNWLQFLSDIGLSGQHISLEITEGVLLRSTEVVEGRLQHYRNAGMELALDDFGTGYSSMAYLQKFNIDYVKIDQSFVRDIGEDAGCRAIVEAIIMMAHKLGKKVIAEGIETRAQQDLLTSAGCDFGQGYLFSHAVPANQLIRMLATNSHYPHSGLTH